MNFKQFFDTIYNEDLNANKCLSVFMEELPVELENNDYPEYAGTFKLRSKPINSSVNAIIFHHISKDNNNIYYYDERGVFLTELIGLTDSLAFEKVIAELNIMKKSSMYR